MCLFHPPLLAARQKLGNGKIVVPTPAQSQASSVAVRKEADKSFVDWVDKEIGKFYANGQTQKWYEEFLVDFGLDPKARPAGHEGDARQVVAGGARLSFGTPMHAWNFAPVWANADLLALGLLNTLKVTGAALACGVPLGLVLALMRLSPRRVAAWPAGCGDRGLPHHAAAGAAVLVLLRAADPDPASR